jgi:hypothetical protein
MERAYPAICPTCGERMGVYEPLVVIDGDEVRTTSRTREPLLMLEDVLVIHRACYAGEPDLI